MELWLLQQRARQGPEGTGCATGWATLLTPGEPEPVCKALRGAGVEGLWGEGRLRRKRSKGSSKGGDPTELTGHPEPRRGLQADPVAGGQSVPSLQFLRLLPCCSLVTQETRKLPSPATTSPHSSPGPPPRLPTASVLPMIPSLRDRCGSAPLKSLGLPGNQSQQWSLLSGAVGAQLEVCRQGGREGKFEKNVTETTKTSTMVNSGHSHKPGQSWFHNEEDSAASSRASRSRGAPGFHQQAHPQTQLLFGKHFCYVFITWPGTKSLSSDTYTETE